MYSRVQEKQLPCVEIAGPMVKYYRVKLGKLLTSTMSKDDTIYLVLVNYKLHNGNFKCIRELEIGFILICLGHFAFNHTSRLN